ncbi:MAG: sulfurtransferase [Variovorax sp.]|nr:MAG: sulfurtransferase [Variovorax sp.]
MNEILNIAAYKFVAIDDGLALRDALRARTQALGLMGTILLAPEGINLFLAGTADAVRGFVDHLRADARFADLETKESWSATQPFRRMLVKLKREIIRMDHPAIQPAAGRAPGVDAPTLKRWLDQGHDDAGQSVVLLDTRNAFEVDHGTFEGAIDWRIEKFTEFPKALQDHRDQLAGRTVVSFCTGGIRCEKAAILMREAGVEDVLQLEGGILKYFEQVGGAHYRGDCFVFDGRRTLAPDLSATGGDASARAAEDPDLAIKR